MKDIASRSDRWRFDAHTEASFARPRASYDCFDAATLQKVKADSTDSADVMNASSRGFENVPADFIGDSWEKVHASAWLRKEDMPILEGRCLVWVAQHIARGVHNHGR